ncbi:ankyrin [Viridothelium virens]|uniref:Ankyrin n=1 Tax=Viridothelium virens TaxID=1048519 RepID=A0A6A6HL22_VIRVR|nr:ankyrin [Viridothelium virens]
MDPLSLTASIVAVATLAGQTCQGFIKLRGLHNSVPGRVHALHNEVVDLKVVLFQLAAVTQDREALLSSTPERADIEYLLKRAETKLTELDTINLRLVNTCIETRIAIFRGPRWQREQTAIQTLQEEIKSVKSSLNVILGASNSRDMARVRLDLENLSAVDSPSSEDLHNLRQEVLQNNALARQMDSRIDEMMGLLKSQSDRLQEDYTTQLGLHYGSPTYRRRKSTRNNIEEGPQPIPKPEGVSVRLSQYSSVCRPGCPCLCHTYRMSSTPTIADRLLGQLFVGYAGLPVVSRRCNLEACRKAQTPRVNVEYWFPLGFFWSQIVRVQMGVSRSFGPQFQLKTLRRVPDSAPCVNFALEGNVAALKDLFARGLASPQDVSSTRGYSLLRWALYGKQYETCQFLVYAGADIEYRPISPHDDNPKNKACDLFLQGALSEEAKDYLSCLTRMDNFTEEQNFTKLHKIIIGLSTASLEQEAQAHPEEIDATDAKGRTALQWAAALGDDRSVAILLSYQANPNHMDQQFSGPLLDAAAQNHPGCLRLILEAGADPNHPIYKKLKKGNPLNVATRLGSDPIVIETLLDFNSDIESCGPEGRTSLLHAALNDDVAVATLLLENQANINARSITAQTPLTAAIIHNSHHVLQLLLDRWQKYSACPGLQGPNLLQLAAFYGDLETITILKGADHFNIDYDKNFVVSDFETLLRDRRDMSEALVLAFADLMGVINARRPTELVEAVVESGLLDQNAESELFSDAKEYQDR